VPSNPVNPFKELRNSSGFSQALLAKKIGVSKHAILRLEQGMFPEPLPKVLNWFAANYPVSPADLRADYAEFQFETRQVNGRVFGTIYMARFNVPSKHPFITLRGAINPTRAAKLLRPLPLWLNQEPRCEV
jgi:transcriptional regulator with XRE-family HTH domain